MLCVWAGERTGDLPELPTYKGFFSQQNGTLVSRIGDIKSFVVYNGNLSKQKLLKQFSKLSHYCAVLVERNIVRPKRHFMVHKHMNCSECNFTTAEQMKCPA